ncbi:MAG: cyclophilin-like fold protein [Clostridium sp.]|nr:cyclophilin-like fold protein [Clostridium sp.]MCM1398344.1 cyclophilin-like fold protein [Clostridium sp.]MCM1458991.1 cyclophilin-like fold protein [Bacteroides sp.]
MKKNSIVFYLILLVALTLTGCGKSDSRQGQSGSNMQVTETQAAQNKDSEQESTDTATDENKNSDAGSEEMAEIEVCFGDNGAPFILHLYNNDTAAAIEKHVGTASWRLPIYHYDDYENWEVMQYYDVPERYEIPSNPETITKEKAGEVYYSDPNRIVLFFGDAEVTGEYTKVGYFDYTEEFKSAVENNPVLEGWGNKIVLIKSKN